MRISDWSSDVCSSDLIQTGGDVQIQGGSVTVGNVTANGGVLRLDASTGSVVATGTSTSGRDILIDTAAGGTLNRLVAGDDIAIGGSGDMTGASMRASDENAGGDDVGRNVGGKSDGTAGDGRRTER